ncbi:MAG: EAL domain-containing protein [Peptostreptococcaceae bacterium]|nr:EAL domain-containing protein [Peptostreptococcaceae bacterium]
MDVFIARQPIFNVSRQLIAYELLFRDNIEATQFSNIDGTTATSILLSDALTVFGLENLTNGKPAFINFTRKLIMNDFAYVCTPDEIVIEVVEDTLVDEVLAEKLKELKNAGYRIAIDDYVGDESFDRILDYADIIKVDFLNMPLEKREAISKKLTKMGKVILAEKVESIDDFQHAVKHNYSLFQGFYFSRPNTIKKKSLNIHPGSYVQMIRELSKGEPDFNNLTDSVKKNVGLTYKLLQHINTLRYFRYFRVKSIRMALVTLGLDEIRRWVLLMMARDLGRKNNEEFIKMAFIRGIFAEKITLKSRHKLRSNEAFIMGMFSMMDMIAEADIQETLKDMPLEKDIVDAILGDEESDFFYILNFVISYEQGDWEKISELESEFMMTRDEMAKCYFDCIFYTDTLFDTLSDN